MRDNFRKRLDLEIWRFEMNEKEIVKSVQNCFDKSQTSLILRTAKLGVRNFINQPFSQVLLAFLCVFLTFYFNVFLYYRFFFLFFYPYFCVYFYH